MDFTASPAVNGRFCDATPAQATSEVAIYSNLKVSPREVAWKAPSARQSLNGFRGKLVHRMCWLGVVLAGGLAYPEPVVTELWMYWVPLLVVLVGAVARAFRKDTELLGVRFTSHGVLISYIHIPKALEDYVPGKHGITWDEVAGVTADITPEDGESSASYALKVRFFQAPRHFDSTLTLTMDTEAHCHAAVQAIAGLRGSMRRCSR